MDKFCTTHKHVRFLFVLLVSLLLAGGCKFLDSSVRAGAAPQYDDTGIKSGIVKALVTNNGDKAKRVSVHSYSDHVFLIGIADDEFRRFALATAKAQKDVKDVTTHWIKAEGEDRMSDAVIAAEIESKILFSKNLQSSRMAVDVYAGTVVLTGKMEKEKYIDEVVDIARSAPNVKNVVSYLIED